MQGGNARITTVPLINKFDQNMEDTVVSGLVFNSNISSLFSCSICNLYLIRQSYIQGIVVNRVLSSLHEKWIT